MFLALSSLALGQSRVRGGVIFNGSAQGQNFATMAAPSAEDNINCNASNVWIGGATDGPATLPTHCLNTAIANTPAPSGQLQATITNASMPTPMSAFKTELAAAVCGEIIYLAPGTNLQSTVATDLTFPSKGCDNAHWIWIASTAINSAWPLFPPVGQRITPCFAGVSVAANLELQWPIDNLCSNAVASFITTSAQTGTITFAPGADHYRFMGIRFARPAGAFGYKIVSASRDGSGNDTYTVTGNLAASSVAVGSVITVAKVSDATFNVNQTVTSITLPSTFKTLQLGKPIATATGGMMAQVQDVSNIVTFTPDGANGQHHIIFDRSLVQGTPDTETKSGIQLGDSNTVAFIDGWIDEIHCFVTVGTCVDSKTIAGALTTNASAGNYKIVNNFLEAAGESTFFGGGAATTTPNDMEVRRNWLYKPAYWNPLDVSNYNGGGPPPTATAAFNVKNGGELKNFNRVLYEANVHSRAFITSDQRGDGFVLSPKNQSSVCPICTVTNVTVRYEESSFLGRPFQLADVPSDPPANAIAAAGNTYSIHDIVSDDLGSPLIGTSYTPQMFTMQGTPQFNLSNVTLNHVTLVSDRTALMVTMSGPPATWTSGKPIKIGDPITPSVYTDPPTVFVSQTTGTTGAIEPVWPARLSGSTKLDNGITWREDSAHLNLYLMNNMVVKNSILSSTAGDGIHATGGGNTNCLNNTVGATITAKLDACWAPGYVFTNNVIYGPPLVWPQTNFTPGSATASHPFGGFDDFTVRGVGGWQQCTGPCAGGSTPSLTSQLFNQSPDLDGGAMLLGLDGPNTFTLGGANNGWFLYNGIHDSDRNFVLDFQIFTPSVGQVASQEFDQFQYLLTGSDGATHNTRLYFGTQCIKGGHWNVWDSFLPNGWVDVPVACNLTAGPWHHIVINVHRVAGDTSGSGGYPKMYYDSIAVDGVTVVSNIVTSAGPLPAGWAEQSGFMLQLDALPTCGNTCTISSYFDSATFSSSGDSVGFVAYNSGIGGDYRLCTAPGIPDPACLVGSDYAANGAHPADDAKDMGADIGLIDTKTAGVEVLQ